MSASDPALEGAAHIVQLALTPVFLLSGIAALVNVFATRYGRVADQAHVLAGQKGDGPDHDARLRLLRVRSRALDWAVVLAASAGASTCGAALALFLGAVRGSAGATLLFWLFGSGLTLTVAALGAFVLEMLLAARGVRRLLDRSTSASLRKRRERVRLLAAEPGDLEADGDEPSGHGEADVVQASEPPA